MKKLSILLLLSLFIILSFSSCTTTSKSDITASLNDIIRDIQNVKKQIIKERGQFFYSKEFQESESSEQAMEKTENKNKKIELALKVLDEYKLILKDTKDKKEQIAYIKESIEKYLKDAEDNDAYIWIPDEVEAVNNLYFESTRKYKNYELEVALNMYSETLYKAQQMPKNAKEKRAIRETDERMYKQLEALESAAVLPVYDENNKLIKPPLWNGRDIIETKTLNFNKLKKSNYILASTSPIMLAYEEDDILEIATPRQEQETKSIDLIEKARQLWQQGVEARNTRNYRLANELFLESAKYLVAYRGNAISELYVVKIKDTLWGISKKLYKNPYLWPKIWFSNRQQVQNPDLIEIDWQLRIPNK